MPQIKDNIGWILAVVTMIVYTAWMTFFRIPPTPTTAFIPSKPSVTTPKVEGVTIKTPIKIVPKTAVIKKHPAAQIKDDEEWVDTVDFPPAPNGAVVLTKIDTLSGEVTNQIQNKKAPWFSFEDNNYIGIGAEQHIGDQQYYKIYYKRDLVRIKDVHLQFDSEAKAGNSDIQGFVGVNIELRF